MKKMFSLVFSLFLALSLAACGSGGNSGKDSTGQTNNSSGGEITGQTIKVLVSEEPGNGNPFATALRDWEAATGNKVDIIVIPYDDQLAKFPAMAKNKDLPDLISTTRLHQLYPDEFVDMSTVVDTSEFVPTALKIVGKDYLSDKIVGLPIQYTTTNIYYNKDAFEKAGLNVPTVDQPWTLDELYANAAVLQEKGGVKYGFAADPSRARYDNLVYANGGSLVEKAGDSFAVAVNSPQNVATLERFIEENNKVMPKAIWSGGTSDNPADYFKNGDVGIYLSGSWNYSSFSNDIKSFKFGVMPSPKGSAGRSAIIGGGAVAVPENAKNKEAAKSFVQWFFEQDNFKNYLNNDKGLSALNNVIYEPQTEEGKKDYQILQAEVGNVSDLFMIDESSAWRTFLDNEYRDAIKRAVSGEITAKQALDGFAKALAEKSGWSMKY
ncbi:ABC transporter substrate-binding protein [Paenibacillus tarimensis]